MIALMMVIMTGCARQPTLNASRDLISVTVLPAGPPSWVYTVQSSHVENLTVIEFVSPALEGFEVLALPEEIENGFLAQVKISDFQGRPRQKMGAIYKKGRYLSRSAQSFLEAMRGKAL